MSSDNPQPGTSASCAEPESAPVSVSPNVNQPSVIEVQCNVESGNPPELELSTVQTSTPSPIQSNNSEDCLIMKAPISNNDNENMPLPPNYEDTAPSPIPRRYKKREVKPDATSINSPSTSSNSSSTLISPGSIESPDRQENDKSQDQDKSEMRLQVPETPILTLRRKLEPPKKYLPMEVYATIVAAFSFLCIGLQRAYTSPAIASMKEDHTFFHVGNPMSQTVVSWVAASPPLASFFGTILSGLALQYLGRQKTLVFLTLPYIAGWLIIGFAQNTAMIMTGRALTGLAAGFSTAAAPMYVSECVRAKVRGFLGFLPPMMLSLGILLGFVMSTISLAWQELAFLNIIFPVILVFLAIIIPESPSWLLYRGKEKAAIESLKKLRGLDDQDDSEISKVTNSETNRNSRNKNPDQLHEEIEKEIEEMKRVVRKRHSTVAPMVNLNDPESGEGKEESETFMDFVFTELLGKREIRLPAFISVSLFILQQMTGANAVIYYLSVILNEADPTLPNAAFMDAFSDGNHQNKNIHRNGLDPNVASVIFGLVQFFAFFMSLNLIDRLGRRILLMVSALLMIIPHLVLGLYFWVKLYPNNYIHVYKYSSIITFTSGWLPLICLCAFIGAFSIGFGPVPFIIMGEIFPTGNRAYMVALASLVNHLTLFFVIRVFPTFFDLLGAHIVFWTFAVFCLMALIHVAIFVPETKGKSLAEIELGFKDPKAVQSKKSEKKNKKKKGEKASCNAKCECKCKG